MPSCPRCHAQQGPLCPQSHPPCSQCGPQHRLLKGLWPALFLPSLLWNVCRIQVDAHKARRAGCPPPGQDTDTNHPIAAPWDSPAPSFTPGGNQTPNAFLWFYRQCPYPSAQSALLVVSSVTTVSSGGRGGGSHSGLALLHWRAFLR